MRFLEGVGKINKIAAFGPITYGTTLYNLVSLFKSLGIFDPAVSVVELACLSCSQFLEGSPFLQKLNADGDTLPGVQYMFMASKTDEQ
ncbi:hypothetical protein BGZ72_006305, partial [Mortierella alpina]